MLNKLSHKELLTLFSNYTDSDIHSFFIVNEKFKIVFANHAFENFVYKSTEEIINSHFGDALGCMYMNKDKNACGKTYYCEICKIREVIERCFENHEKISNQDVVRDMKIGNDSKFKHLSLSVYYIDIEKTPHVAISLYNVADF